MPEDSSMPQSSGRVVLITGGSRGIGLATAQGLPHSETELQ